MIYLLGIPALAYAYYYYCNNKKKIGTKFVDMYASLAVLSKETFFSKGNDDFILIDATLIYKNNNLYNKL